MNTTDHQLPNPFPGLRPFRSDEHHLFFGREEQTAALLQLLRTNRFLAVVGTSGSGKSSLVRAGMIAELHGGTMTQAGSTWEVMILRPGGSPIENLARAFVDADLYDPEDPNTLPRLLATLNRSRFGLVEAMKQSEVFEAGTNLLVVVDQFEELFRFRQQGVDSEETAAAFVNLLLTASEQTECPIYVTITMRSDYLGDCSEIPGLAEAVNEGEYLIPRLARDQKRDAIEKPIGVGGAKISPLLVQRLLNEVGDDPDQLPVLQHALMRMWDAWSAGNDHKRPIEFGDFEATGGLGAALSNHADEIYDSLPDDRHRSACAKIFKTLTVKGDDNRGIRRPTRLAHLQAIAAADRDTVTTVLDAFRGSGVTFLMPGMEVELRDRTVLDLSHESLMRGWQRLRGWVEDEAQSARVFRRLLDTARLWSDGKAGLFRDPDLQIALSWREHESPNAEWAEQYGGHFEKAIGFLETSQAEAEAERQAKEAARQRELEQAQELAESRKQRLIQQRRAAKRLRKLIAGLAVVAVIAGLACVAALIANQRANTLAENARQNEEKAKQSQQETANALTQVESQKTELESQKAAVESSLSKAEKAEQIARAAEEAGRKLLYTTDMRLAPFVWRDDRTTAEQLRVLLAKHIPPSPIPLSPRGRGKGEGDTTAGTKPDLRGFEWHYYQHLLEQNAAVFSGHGVSVTGGAFTSNGQLVTLDQNGRVRRWDPGSQDEDKVSRRDLPGGPSAQVRVLSPNGRLAALAEGNKVHVFDTSTGKETFQINSASNQWRRLIFSRDSDRLVIVDDKIRWLSAVNGEVIASVDQKFERIESLAFSADGLTLAVVGHGNMGGQISIFRLDATAKKVTPLAKDIGPGGTLNASALSPDGQRIAVGAKLSGSLSVYDTATGRMIASHESAHASLISAMAFSSDGAKLATADAEGTIKIWADAQKLNSKSTAFVTLKGHQGTIVSVGFASDGKRLVTTSADKTARVWDLENAGAAIRKLERSFTPFVARFSPDGQLIATSGGSSARLWDAATGRLVREMPASDNKGYIVSVAFSPTDNRLLALGYGGQADASYVALWDIDAGTELARLPGATDLPDFPRNEYTGMVGALAFSPDGKYLVAGFGSKSVFMGRSLPMPLKVWEVATRRLIRRLNGHTNFCVALDFSRDGKLLASGSRDGTAILWSTQTWNKAQTLQNPDPASLFSSSGRSQVEGVAFSPDGKTLAVASFGGNMHLWDVAAGKLLETLKGHSSAVEAVVFSPDGRTLASGGTDQTIRLWNVETRRELMQLDKGSVELGQVQTLAFSPDGKHLLAGGYSGTAFWSAAPIVWNDADRAAEKLRLLLQSNADFQSRIRMLSENLRLHEALAKLDAKDMRVRAALAATRANWHASQQRWVEAAKEVDRLLAADPTSPEAWLRTPGLLRLATALLGQNRPRDAAALLKGGAKRRRSDGLPDAVDRVTVGVSHSAVDGTIQVTDLRLGSPAARSGLRPGDVILKVNDTELTRASLAKFDQLLEGEPGSKVRLTVRHPGSEKSEVIELTRERFVNDAATGELLHPLRTAINERLAKEPRNTGLLELRAELAGQWSDAQAQVADYTAAIDALSQQKAEAAAADLKRLYGRRGNAYVAMKQWQQAVDDYARAVTEATTDDALLSSQALALAEVLLSSKRWTVLKPVEAKSEPGATLSILPDDSILASGANPLNDRYRVVLTIPRDIDLAAVRLEALAHPSLPRNGPGRHPVAGFAQTSWKVTAASRDRKDPITLQFDKAWADYQLREYPITSQGHWNTGGVGEGQNCTAVWSMSKPVSLAAGTMLTFQMQFKEWNGVGENLGHFRLSVSSDSAAIEREQKYLALTNPWQKLATAYQLNGDQRAIDQLVQRRPKLAGTIGDLFTQGKDEDKDWKRAVEIYSRGITAGTTDADLLSKRARAYEALKKWEAAAADWSRAATGNLEGAKLLADFARRLAAAGQAPLANVQFDKSQALYERSLAAEPEKDVVVTELAQLLLDKEAYGRWTVLQPTEIKSQGGATFTKLGDQSILVGGVNPDKDTYTFVAPTDLPKIKAIRLEALAHESLANGGPGRSPWGNFALSEISVKAEPCSGATKAAALKLINPQADFEQDTYPVAASLDGNSGTAWSIDPERGKNHAAVFEIESSQQAGFKGGTKLTFKLDFQFNNKHAIGCFRLSVSPDPATPDREQKHFAVGKVTDSWLKLAAAYAMNGRTVKASPYFIAALKRAEGYEAKKPIVELAARFDDLLFALVQRQPDDPQLQLALARKLAERGKQRLAEKQPTKAQAELEKARRILTRLCEGPKWAVLTPTELKSQGGETLSVEQDGSIFVSGPNPNRAVYTLKLRTDLPTLTAIRLETIPDARLPDGGAGRYGNGNFHVSEFNAAIVSGQADARPIPIEFASAMADFSQDTTDPPKSIDGDPRTRWDTHPRMKEPHWAVFLLKSPARMDGGSLRITLDSGISQWGYHGLGRFRLFVTNDADLSRAVVRNDLKDSEVVDLCIALAKADAQQGHLNEAMSLFAEALDLATDRVGKVKIITESAPLEGVLEKLAERAAGDAQFQAELARHFAERGKVPLAEAARAKAHTLFEEKLAKEPENTALVAELADLLLPPIDAKAAMMVPTSENEGVVWRFTTSQPPANWMREEFDDSTWTTGPGSFGNGWATGLVLRTPWKTSDIWLRRKFEWKPNSPVQSLLARVIHDDSFELFINGQQILSRQEFTRGYTFYPLDAKALGLLKPGTNTMAVHCFSILGAQYIDVGLHGLSSNPRVTLQRSTVTKTADPWAKLAAAYYVLGDRPALDKLLKDHPAAAAGVGDLYAADQDWKRAIAEYTKALTPQSKDARIFAGRALAHEQLEHWELAAADWGNVDRYASDKKIQYGNPSFPALERRAHIHGRLQQYDKQVQDWTELLKPERLGDNPWIFRGRGESYDRLRQWTKARADYDRAIELSAPNEREAFQFFRAGHFAAQSQWRQAADELRPLYQKPVDANKEWWRLRDASLIFAIAGDVENYGKVAAECYHKQAAGNPNSDESKWTVLTMLLLPEMITQENRPRLLELAGKTDTHWRPRLTAAIHFRSGDSKKAVELFDANGGGQQFFFLSAMVHKKMGNPKRAKQLLEEGNSWVREQCAKDPKAGVPQSQAWQDWATVVTLQYEASDLILGPGVGSNNLPERAVGEAQFQAALARHFAERGNAPAADAARAKARALFAEKLAKEPKNTALAADLLSAYQSAGRTREAIPHLAKASAANPKDTLLSLKVAALQAWFGQEKELAATRQRIRAFAKDTKEAVTAERAAKACSVLPSTDKAELEAALALVRAGMKLGKVGEFDEWNLLALGMAEYRSRNYAAAAEALLAAAKAGKNNPHITGTAAFYRAMSLFRQGKKDEARKLAVTAAVKMKPLPADEQNPLANVTAPPGGGDTQEYLIMWLAHKEARTLLKIELSPIELLEEARNDEVKTLGADHPTTVATTLKLVDTYVASGRTRESVPLLASASAANPKDTILSLEVATRQAWFGQEKEFAATRQRILAFAKGTGSEFTANQAAKACSIRASADKAELEAALALGRKGVELGKGGKWQGWNLLALGMAEYRSRNYAAAAEALLAAAKAGKNNPHITGTAAFYRAMSLFRQGKSSEARQLTILAAAKMKPLPKDENNPLAGGADHNDLILWMAYKEAKTMIKFEAAAPPKEKNDKR